MPEGQVRLICALGDLLLDVVVTGRGPVQTAADTYSSITVGAGGQAANVAAWVVALGGRSRLVTKRAAGPVGDMVLAQLTGRGVEVVGPVVPEGDDASTGVVVSLSGFDDERSMLTDRGVAPLLEAAELSPDWFGPDVWLHLPLYSLVDAPIRGAALAARERCPHLSLDLSSITVIRALGSQAVRRLVAQLEPDVVFANEAEAAAVPLEDVPVAVVKLGDRGVLLNGTLHQATAVEMVDTTGAGDAMAAGFLFGGIELGLAAAARAVSQTGALPAGKPATAGKAGAPLGAGATTWR
jgi:sugar/nucleoside kinase (ribokinase family)